MEKRAKGRTSIQVSLLLSFLKIKVSRQECKKAEHEQANICDIL